MHVVGTCPRVWCALSLAGLDKQYIHEGMEWTVIAMVIAARLALETLLNVSAPAS